MASDAQQGGDRERLAAVLEASPDLLGMASPEGQITYLNRAGRELLRLPLEGPLPDLHIRDFYPPEGLTRIYDVAMPAALEHGSWSGENIAQSTSGELIPVSQVIIVNRDERGEVDFVTTVARDIRELKELDRLKDEFVATVSHELRTPLTALRGSLGLLLGNVVGELPAPARELLGIAQENAERLIRLVEDVLDLEKIEAERLEVRREPVPLQHVVADAVAALEPGAAARGMTIVRGASGDAVVVGDRDRLVQVVTNLLDNAIKFAPEGTSIAVRTERPARSRIRVWVEDGGPGIPAEDVGKLFEPFRRLEVGNDRGAGGTGLGLTIARAIVEQHGGHIGVESTPGQGSRFWFELPLRRDPGGS